MSQRSAILDNTTPEGEGAHKNFAYIPETLGNFHLEKAFNDWSPKSPLFNSLNYFPAKHQKLNISEAALLYQLTRYKLL